MVMKQWPNFHMGEVFISASVMGIFMFIVAMAPV